MYRLLFALSIVVILASCQSTVHTEDHAKDYSHWLEGIWTAPYYFGQISETWSFDNNGFLCQEGLYEENWDTIYWEKIKIDTLGEDVFLIAKPHNAPGFIYQQMSVSDTTIVFENKTYSNPYQIKYEKLGNNHFRKTNIGIVDGQEVNTPFQYTRFGEKPQNDGNLPSSLIDSNQEPQIRIKTAKPSEE